MKRKLRNGIIKAIALVAGFSFVFWGCCLVLKFSPVSVIGFGISFLVLAWFALANGERVIG